MNKKLVALLSGIIVIIVVSVVVFSQGNLFSVDLSNNSSSPTPVPSTSSSPTTPTPTQTASTVSPTPTASPTQAASPTPTTFAMTISYQETSREDTGLNSLDINIAMQARTNDGSTRNLLLDKFYVTIGGVEVQSIFQTSGNAYVDPGYIRDITLTLRLPSGIGNNYQLNYRDGSFSIDWIKTNLTPTPTPL